MRIGSAGVHASFGVGLAFYATSSTDAALATLPASQAGAGSGIYKMVSSLGAAFDVAISATPSGTVLYRDVRRYKVWINAWLVQAGWAERQDRTTSLRAAEPR